MYSETRNMTSYGDSDYHSVHRLLAVYLRPSIAYLQSKGKDLGGQDMDSHGNYRYTDKDLVKYVDVGMTYYFNKNIPFLIYCLLL
ncbi:putative porin [Salmonella enterica subsp. enterica serovar Montevideo str. S5-403]|uniref:Putative porin n=1 Tax=Salmonella enterica subsp. enterica serovar Montevideo str. S5-403 TaxID=913242 RepID=G5Q116_SALMO|nr:putative porin [Salmonella enterica subsp. enterica serovar Montevideo str. S5-403]